MTEINGFLAATQEAAEYQRLDCDDNNVPIEGATFAFYQPESSGNYSLLTTYGNCSETYECYSYSVLTTAKEVGLADSLKLYPSLNPGTFVIENGLEEIDKVIIYDVHGKNLSVMNPNAKIVEVKLLNVAPGIYFVLIRITWLLKHNYMI